MKNIVTINLLIFLSLGFMKAELTYEKYKINSQSRSRLSSQISEASFKSMIQTIKDVEWHENDAAYFGNYYHVLPEFIKKYNFKKGCEVGVSTGLNSYSILKNTDLEILHSVDPYLCYGDSTNFGHNLTQDFFDIFFFYAQDKFSVFGQRSNLIRMPSVEASKEFKDGELDFVFIDANHEYAFVLEDLELWYAKVHSGGLFSGDDYETIWPGVKKAVDEFALKKGLTISLYPGLPRFWYIIKP